MMYIEDLTPQEQVIRTPGKASVLAVDAWHSYVDWDRRVNLLNLQGDRSVHLCYPQDFGFEMFCHTNGGFPAVQGKQLVVHEYPDAACRHPRLWWSLLQEGDTGDEDKYLPPAWEVAAHAEDAFDIEDDGPFYRHGLSIDQCAALDAVQRAVAQRQREIVLCGAAGTGKTRLLRPLLDELNHQGVDTLLVAPTGKAAVRVQQVTGHPAYTVHSVLYRTCDAVDGKLVFGNPRPVLQEGGVVICDEASMLGSQVYADMLAELPDSCSLVCVGDREQLQPVGDTWGPDFDNPTAMLTEVHRQAAESPILQVATALRCGQPWLHLLPEDAPADAPLRLVRATHMRRPATWLAKRRAEGTDATLLTFSNQTRHAVNSLVRTVRGLHGDVQVGDYLVCCKTSRANSIFNGEVREVWQTSPTVKLGVHKVTWRGGSFDMPVALATIVNSASPRQVLVDYGECLTVHKAQGSQWDAVGIVHDSAMRYFAEKDPAAYRRLMYTAVTRAANRLVIFDV